MAARRSQAHVRVVTDEDHPPQLLSLAEAIASGSYLEILKAQRRDIVVSLPNEKGPAKAALHRQLSIISKEIEELSVAATDGSDGSVVATTDDAAWDSSVI